MFHDREDVFLDKDKLSRKLRRDAEKKKQSKHKNKWDDDEEDEWIQER